MKFYCKEFTDVMCSDVFMYLNKRLHSMLNNPQNTDDQNEDLSFSRANRDLMGGNGSSPGLKKNDEKLEYGLTKYEIASLKIDLVEFDK